MTFSYSLRLCFGDLVGKEMLRRGSFGRLMSLPAGRRQGHARCDGGDNVVDWLVRDRRLYLASVVFLIASAIRGLGIGRLQRLGMSIVLVGWGNAK